MKKNICILAVFIFSLTFSAPMVFGAGKSAAEFYKGKTVEYVIPYGVGGGTDRLSRMLIHYLEKRMGCNIVPSNKAGAGGLIGLNHLWSSKKNGLVMGTVMYDAAVWSTFTKSKAARFDVDKLTMIGGIEKQALVLLSGKDSRYKSFADLVNTTQPALISIPGKMSTMHVMMSLASDVWDFPVKFVSGYKGAAAFFKAAEGGEVDVTVGSEVAAYPRVKAGTLQPLAYITTGREDFFPDVPSMMETPTKNLAELERFKSAVWIYRYARSLGMPPGVPEDRAEFVREALKDVLKNPKLLAEGKKNGIPFLFTNPEEMVRQKDKLFGNMNEQDQERVRKLFK